MQKMDSSSLRWKYRREDETRDRKLKLASQSRSIYNKAHWLTSGENAGKLFVSAWIAMNDLLRSKCYIAGISQLIL